MLKNLILNKKMACGLATVSVAGGGSYYAYEKGWFTPDEDFLIVETTAITTNNSDANLYKSNYKCVLKTAPENIDNYCRIKKLSDADKKLATALKNVNSPDASKDKLKEEKNYYRIFAKKSLLDKIKKWDADATTELIEVVKKDNSTTNNIFAKVKPIYRVWNQKIINRRNSFVVAKVDADAATIEQPNVDIWNNYECQIEKETFECEVSEVSFSNKKTYDVNTTTESALNKTNLKTSGKNFRIKLTEEYLNKISFNNAIKKINVVEKDPKDINKKTFAVLTPQFTLLDQAVSGKNEFLLAAIAETTSTNVSADSDWATKYKNCSINQDTNKVGCEIYKFATEQTTTTVSGVKNITISDLTKITSDGDIKSNNYFAIKLNNSNTHNLKNDDSIVLKTETANKKNYTFTVKARIYLDATFANNKYTVTGAYIIA